MNVEKEQRNDPHKVNVKTWILNKIKPETTYSTYDLKKYHKHLSRITLEHGILYRKFFDHTGQNYHKQLVVPKHLRTELLYRIHNSKMKGHLGIQKTVRELRRKYYFPGFIDFLVVYINNCLTCAQAKSPQHKYLTPPLNPLSSNTSLPADMLQIDIVGKLPHSGGYSNILTGMELFTKYVFAQPLTSISAETVAKFLIQWFMRHSYIPLLIVTDQGSQFVSKLLHELANILEIKLEHATVKHAQTIGVVERSHGPLKRYLRIYENKLQHDWHKQLDLAVFQQNTSYHTTIGCPPTLIFHGRIPMNPIDIRFNNRSLYHHSSRYDYISDLQSKMTALFEHTKELLVEIFQQI